MKNQKTFNKKLKNMGLCVYCNEEEAQLRPEWQQDSKYAHQMEQLFFPSLAEGLQNIFSIEGQTATGSHDSVRGQRMNYLTVLTRHCRKNYPSI